MTNRRNRPISIIRNTAPCKSPTHGGGLLDLRCGELGRPGLEPGTNPESVRGCSHNQSKNRNKNTAGCGFFLHLRAISSFRASAIEGSSLVATTSSLLPNRCVV